MDIRHCLGSGLAIAVLALAVALPARAECTGESATAPACRLIAAVRMGDLAGVKRALAEGADPDTRTAEGEPLLLVALKLPNAHLAEKTPALVPGRRAVARHLIERGIDVRAADANGMTALHLAAMDARLTELLRPLLARGADPNAVVGHYRETPLILAIDADNRAAMRILLRGGADVNQPILEGITPLMYAVLKGEPESAKLLLAHGAAIDRPNAFGVTPLAMAVALGRLQTIDLLIRSGADPDLKVNDRLSPRELAQTKDEEIRAAFRDAVARYKKDPPRN